MVPSTCAPSFSPLFSGSRSKMTVCLIDFKDSQITQSNRDRGRPHDLSPPTPPARRVTYPAVRGRQWRSHPANRRGRPSAATERGGSAIALAGR